MHYGHKAHLHTAAYQHTDVSAALFSDGDGDGHTVCVVLEVLKEWNWLC